MREKRKKRGIKGRAPFSVLVGQIGKKKLKKKKKKQNSDELLAMSLYKKTWCIVYTTISF